MVSTISGLALDLFLWLWVCGLVCVWLATKRNGRARFAGIVFLISVWILGTRPAAELLLRPLEGKYTPLPVEQLRHEKIEKVVVLTGGGYDLHNEALSSALPHASMFRFVGGMELCGRLGPDCTIIFSGTAGGPDGRPTASYMERLAQVLSPGRKIISESLSGRTSEHPGNVKALLGKEPFVLVTSAYHMTRSIKAFRKAGLDPIPYPVDFLVQGGYYWNDLFPSADSLEKIQIALHEYVGLLYYAMRGYI